MSRSAHWHRTAAVPATARAHGVLLAARHERAHDFGVHHLEGCFLERRTALHALAIREVDDPDLIFVVTSDLTLKAVELDELPLSPSNENSISNLHAHAKTSSKGARVEVTGLIRLSEDGAHQLVG